MASWGVVYRQPDDVDTGGVVDVSSWTHQEGKGKGVVHAVATPAVQAQVPLKRLQKHLPDCMRACRSRHELTKPHFSTLMAVANRNLR